MSEQLFELLWQFAHTSDPTDGQTMLRLFLEFHNEVKPPKVEKIPIRMHGEA